KYDVSDASSVGVIGARDMASLKGLKPLPTGELGAEKTGLEGMSLVLLINRDLPSAGFWDLKPETLHLAKTEKIDSSAYLDTSSMSASKLDALSPQIQRANDRMSAVFDEMTIPQADPKDAGDESITTVLDDFTSLAERVTREGKLRGIALTGIKLALAVGLSIFIPSDTGVIPTSRALQQAKDKSQPKITQAADISPTTPTQPEGMSPPKPPEPEGMPLYRGRQRGTTEVSGRVPRPFGPEEVDEREVQSIASFREGDFAKTAELCSSLLKVDVRNHYVRLRLGKALFELGRVQEAVEQLDTIVGYARRTNYFERQRDKDRLIEEWNAKRDKEVKSREDFESLTGAVREIVKKTGVIRALMDQSKQKSKLMRGTLKYFVEDDQRVRSYQIFGRLTLEKLKDYDVLTMFSEGRPYAIDGRIVLPTYSQDEIDAIKSYVHAGGGLVIAPSMLGWMRTNVGLAASLGTKPFGPEEVPVQKIADEFGVKLLATRIAGDQLSNLTITDDGVFDGLDGDFVRKACEGSLFCGLEATDDRFKPIVSTAGGVAVMGYTKYGKGCVVVMSNSRPWSPDSTEAKSILFNLIKFAGARQVSIDEGLSRPLWNIKSGEQIRIKNVIVCYPEELQMERERFERTATRAIDFLEDFTGRKTEEVLREGHLVQYTVAKGSGAQGKDIGIGGLGDEELVLRITTHELGHAFVRLPGIEEYFVRYAAIRCANRWGYEMGAKAQFDGDVAEYRAAIAQGKKIDMWGEPCRAAQGNALLVFQELEERYGPEIFRRLIRRFGKLPKGDLITKELFDQAIQEETRDLKRPTPTQQEKK
ncbi:MAG: tetratricopeptide repeat protein, partial [Candidatus Altiarchaeota archaeon]|nr:tetratricopeptide repeat protein [Candidatus Altiarchaeota archaeon]